MTAAHPLPSPAHEHQLYKVDDGYRQRFAAVYMQKSVAKLNGHMEEVKAAIEHEADKLKAFEADQTALKDRCRLFTNRQHVVSTLVLSS